MIIIIITVIVILGFIILSRPEIRLRFYSYLDPVSGKDLRELGYKLVYVRQDSVGSIEKGKVAVIKCDLSGLNSGDIVYVKKKYFALVTGVNREKRMIRLADKSFEISYDLVTGYVVGVESL